MVHVLKVFPSKQWHDSVSIVGNKESLQKLINTIQKSIDDGFSDSNFMETDGEEYKLNIKLIDKDFDSSVWDDLPMHYTDEMCKDPDPSKWNNLIKILN